MEEISIWFYMIVQTTWIGVTSYLVWKLICFLAKGHNMRYRYAFLKIQLIFWLVPLGVLMNYRKYYDFRGEAYRGTLMESPLGVHRITQIIVILWLFGCVCKMIIRYKQQKEFFALTELNEPADEDILMMAEIIRKELKVTVPVQIHISPVITTALTYRKKGTHIVIPGIAYTDEELRMLLYHELIHVKYHDVIMKKLVAVVNITQWFNPLAMLYKRDFFLWMEIHCDDKACDYYGDYKGYLKFLMEQSVDGELTAEEEAFFLQSSPGVADRMESVMAMRSGKQWKRWTALLCGVLFVGLVTSNAYAAGGTIEEVRSDLNEATIEKTTERNYSDGNRLIEYQKPHSTEGLIVVDMDSPVETYSGTYQSTWVMEPGAYYSRGVGTLAVGDRVSVMVRLEAGMEVGLSYNGIRRYITAPDTSVLHEFTANWRGTHRVYVQNTLDHTVTVDISIHY